MTLSRVRRAQLPSLPAECVWRQRLRPRTAITPPHSPGCPSTRCYSMGSTTLRRQSSSSTPYHCITNTCASALSRHRIVPPLTTQHNQTRNVTFRKSRTQLQMEAKQWALGEMHRFRDENEHPNSGKNKFKDSIKRKRLEKEYIDAHEVVDEKTFYDGTRECKAMIFEYFHQDGSQPKLELPQFRRRGAGVDDIYLYQLLWKATGLVNEITRRKKASQAIYINMEKYRRAQVNQESKERRNLKRMIETKEKVRLVGLQIEKARKEAALGNFRVVESTKGENEPDDQAIDEENTSESLMQTVAEENLEAISMEEEYSRAAPTMSEASDREINRENPSQHLTQARAEKNFEAVRSKGGYLRIGPMMQRKADETLAIETKLGQTVISTGDMGLQSIYQSASEESNRTDLHENEPKGFGVSTFKREVHNDLPKITPLPSVPEQQEPKFEIRTTLLGPRGGKQYETPNRWLKTENGMRLTFSPRAQIEAENPADKNQGAREETTVALETDGNSTKTKYSSTITITPQESFSTQQEKPITTDLLAEKVEAIINGSTTSADSKAASSNIDTSGEGQIQSKESTTNQSGPKPSLGSFMEFKSFLGLKEDNTMETPPPNKSQPDGAIESLYEMALKISQQNNSKPQQLQPWEQLLPDSTNTSNSATDSVQQSKSTTNLSPESVIDKVQLSKGHGTTTLGSNFPGRRPHLSSRRSSLGRKRHPRSQEQRAHMSSKATISSLRDRLKAKMRITPEEILEKEGPQMTLTTNYTEMKGRFVTRAQNLAKELPNDRDTETSETDNDAFIADLLHDASSDGREPSAMIGVSHIKPGSIVEITQRPGLRPEFGVVMQKAKTRSTEYFFIMPGGHISDYSSNHCHYAVPDFIPESKIDEIIAVTRATGEVPGEMLQEVSAKIREFSSNCKKVLLQNALKLQGIGRKLSLDSKFQYLPLEEIARRIFKQQPTEEQKYAAHVTMLQDKEHFLPASRFHIAHQTWEILPKEYIKNIAEVGRWIRKRDSCLKEFAVKAREVIDIVHKAAQERTPTCELIGEPTREYKIEEITWTEQDKAILSFMKWASIEYHKNSDHMNGMYPTVLRLINRSTARGKFDHPALLGFLEEVGVFAPWEDRTTRVRDPRMASLYEDHPVAGRDTGIFNAYVQGANKFEAFQESMEDSMASLRHDWKDLNVYCIDAKEAEEIDDGISVERIPGSSDVWLRIHVANPSAFIPRDHELARISRDRISTLYAPQRSFPMLPPAICREFFSVGPDRPVLTFSARVNTETGETSDYDIRPGKVHNVKRITYHQVDRLFNGESATISDTILTNRPPALRDELLRNIEQDAKKEWEEQETDDLKLMLKTVSAYSKARAKEGLASASSSTYNVYVSDGKGNPFTTSHISDNPYVRIGSPYIDVIRETRVFDPSRPDFIVISGMSLACRIAGEWLAERNIPAPFRALYRIWDNKDSEDRWREAVKFSMDDFGTVLDARLDAMYPTEGVPEISPVPKRHDLLATDKYVKATSPLRRWSDLLTHYVIEHELLNNSLPPSERKPLLFDVEAMAEECKFIQPRERDINVKDFTAKRYWISELIRNLYAAGHPILPKVLQVQITALADWPKLPVGRVRGWPMDNTKIRFTDKEAQQQVQVGDVVFASLSDDVWEYNSIRSAALSLQYIGMRTSATETRQQFFEDLELIKRGEKKASIWPSPLTEAELAELEELGKDIPDSQFVKLRERRIAARASVNKTQTADTSTDVIIKAQTNAAEDLRQDEIADLDRVSHLFDKADSARALAEALAVVEKRATEKVPKWANSKKEERLRSAAEHGMVINIREKSSQEVDHSDFMELLQTVADKTSKPKERKIPTMKASSDVKPTHGVAAEKLVQDPSDKTKDSQKHAESDLQNVPSMATVPIAVLQKILTNTQKKLAEIDEIDDDAVKRKLQRKWGIKLRKVESALQATERLSKVDNAFEATESKISVAANEEVDSKNSVSQEDVTEKLEKSVTSGTPKKKPKKAAKPNPPAEKANEDALSPDLIPETEKTKKPKSQTKAGAKGQLMLAKRKLREIKKIKDPEAQAKLQERWEKLYTKYEAAYEALKLETAEGNENKPASEDTDGKVKQAI